MRGGTRLCGVLVTFGRPEVLPTTFDRLAAQTRRLDRLVVVDNGSDRRVEDLVATRTDVAGDIEYLDPRDNVGPAGGFALGMARLLETASDEDWIVVLDDDDPPFMDDAFEHVAVFGPSMVDADPMTGGVGISGGRFDLSTGRVIRIGDAEIRGAVAVDHITGGGLPAYRVAAVRQVGAFRSELFFGFEELEYGLRLTGAGFHLYADGEEWRRRKETKRAGGLLPPEEVSARRATRTTVSLGEPSWRRFYSLRNLVYILRARGASLTAARVALARGIVKPLVNLPVAPTSSWRHLRMNGRAIVDGWRGRLGRTMAPPAAASQED